MKKILSSIIVLIAAAFFFSACDIIEAPYIEKPQNGNDTNTVVRKVLLEDYTGHRCPNCPTAAKVAKDLQTLYGEKLIIMAVHYGFLATPFPGTYSYDFRTTVGDDYGATFGVSSLPTGMVNRKQVSGSYLIGKDNWGSQVAQIINTPADADIQITNSYNSGNRQLDIDIETEFLNTLTGDYNLVVLILESHIIKPQQNNNPAIGDTPDILNYEHNHVLRAAVNGSIGEQIQNTTDSKSYSITLDNEWDADNVTVLAYIHRADDADGTIYEVVQAEEAEL